jgi:hypothetical protein
MKASSGVLTRNPKPKIQKKIVPLWERKFSVADAAKWVYENGTRIAALINTQLSRYDFQPFSASSISSTGTVICLSNVSQGTASTQYKGQEIKATSLELRCRAQVGATPLNTCLRLIVIQDSESNGANPAVTDVIVGGCDGMYNYTNFNPNQTRFRVISDETYNLTTNASQMLSCDLSESFPSKGGGTDWQHIVFQSPFNGSTAAISKNAIFMVAVSDQSVAASEPVLNVFSSLYFESF